MLILVFIALNYSAPSYISDIFTKCQASISLQGKRRLVIPRVNTTNYGLHSGYHASKLWNLLLDNVRVSTSLAVFKYALRTVHLYRFTTCGNIRKSADVSLNHAV